MSTVEDAAEVLLRSQVVSAEQLEEARQLQQQKGGTLTEALVQLGYATAAQAAWAVAQVYGLPYIDLTGVSVPRGVIEIVPESVARENLVFPLMHWKGGLLIAVHDPSDQDLPAKLALILNKDIHIVVAAREQILEAIDRHYEGVEVVVDCMLAEFTDTAIDVESGSEVLDLDAELRQAERWGRQLSALHKEDDQTPRLQEMLCRLRTPEPESGTDATEQELALEDSGVNEADSLLYDLAAPSAAPASKTMLALDVAARGASDTMSAAVPSKSKPLVARSRGMQYAVPFVERQATVRYYCRMNPQRMFPLLVVISKKAIQQVVKKHVKQQQSETFQVALDSHVEIEPVLPGCQVYPPREELKIEDKEVSARFWVVPHVLGPVMQARVVVRQDGQVLTEVPLEMKVVRQSAALLVGMMSFLLPFGLLLMQHFGLDFGAQAQQGHSLYAQGANWLMESMSPELLTALLLGLTAGVWLWLRPRKRDVFWDIAPREPGQQVMPDRQENNGRAKLTGHNHPQLELFQQAERNLRWQRHAMALHLFEKGLALGKAHADIYADAAQAAMGVGRIDRALEILQQAESELGPAAIKGPLWYRMATLATRIGRHEEGIAYLKRAVEAGYADADRLLADPELAPLRERADFQWLLPAGAR